MQVQTLFFVALALAAASAQITFSRDWLAGSGKKRAGQVTFSRDWLASGKRSAETVDTLPYTQEEARELASAMPAATWNLLLDFLASHARMEETKHKLMALKNLILSQHQNN